MPNTLNYYRDYRPEGRLYAFCDDISPEIEITYYLWQENQCIEKKKAHGDEIVGFAIPGPGTFKISSHFDATTFNSNDIVIPAVAILPPRPAAQIKSLKGPLSLIPGVNNYLRVTFFPAGLDKLKNEKQCLVPVYYTSREKINFVPLFNRKALKKQSKAMPTLLRLSDAYKVVGPLPQAQLLALAQELQQLEYVEYCCLSSTLIGTTRPNRGEGADTADSTDGLTDNNDLPPTDQSDQIIADGENNDAQAAALATTPDFTSQQTYLNAGMGLNVRTAWARNATGRGIRIHLAEVRIVAQEDLVNSATIVQESNTFGFEGTSSLGIIRANNNGFGITGIAFNSNVFTYAEEQLAPLVANVRPGDIVAINSIYLEWDEIDFLPIVHNVADWALISHLVSAGAVVIFSSGEAFGASNPIGYNLLEYSRFNNWGDSGAIMACGCLPGNGRRSLRTNYNLYGMLNAWDTGITTTGGWRNFIFDQPPVPFRRYTSNADNSAMPTALIAGTMALIQSYARERYGVVFNTGDMLSIIEITGSRQAQGQMIGVRPNVTQALLEVDFLLGNGPLPPPPPPPYPAWDSARIQYEVGDRVFFQQLNFECLERHLSSPALSPLNTPRLWLTLGRPQTYTRWEVGGEYPAGCRVTYQGENYQCLQRHIAAFCAWSPPRNPLLWLKI